MNDYISRQAAIDALSFCKEMLNRALDDMDLVGTEREKFSWGLGLIESNIYDIEELPSAQPEIIRCKECTYFDKYIDCKEMYQWDGFCADWARKTYENWYCSRAERRNDDLQ